MESEKLRETAIGEVTELLDGLSASESPSDRKKAELLSYWIVDYVRLIRSEVCFNPMDRMKYKRGQIVKIHLGFRIGNEEGGLHYGIVVDNKNPLSSGTVTIVPLTSVKRSKPVHWTSVFLGDEIFHLLKKKSEQYRHDLDSRNEKLSRRLKKVKRELTSSPTMSPEQISAINDEINSLEMESEKIEKKLQVFQKVVRELNKMKTGSIALVGQIVTVSKLRIVDPISSEDSLGSVRVSDATLDQIDAKIRELFMNTNSPRAE